MIQSAWRDVVKFSRDHKVMVKHAGRARFVTKTCIMLSSGACLTFYFCPLFGISVRLRNNITDIHEGYYLPVQSYYPFNYDSSPMFEIVYVTQIIGMWMQAVSLIVPDLLFVALVLHACAQCEILQRKVEDLLDDKQFETKLGEIVEFHNNLIK